MLNCCLVPVLLLVTLPPAQDDDWTQQMHAGDAALERRRLVEADRAFNAALAAAGGWVADAKRQGAALVKIAEVRLAQGKYVQAEQLCQRAYPLCARGCGAESPDVACCLNVQAKACAALRLQGDAESLARLAHDMRKKTRPKEHYDIADSVQTLAAMGLAYEEKRFANEHTIGASVDRSMTRDSLDVQEKALGKDDPKLAACLLASARIVSAYDREERSRAEKVLLRAVAILTKAKGEDSSALADYWTELARLYSSQGKLALAEKTEQQALTLLRKQYGAGHPRLARALVSLSTIQEQAGQFAASSATAVDAARAHFAGLSDIELCATFERLGNNLDAQEEYLLEMIRRKGPTITAYLTRKHSEIYEQRRQFDFKKDLREPPRNLEVLTALRRVQNKSDPLAVVVDGPDESESIFPNLPSFSASLTNVDSQKKLVGIIAGGDYRGGRQERWRFEVRDSKGVLMPCREAPRSGLGGGIFSYDNLKPGNTWDTELNMRSFVELPPGDYTVRIQYHDRLEIGERGHTADLIVCQSEPFHVHVQPRVIDLAKQDRQTAKEALADLDDKAAVKILAGHYTKSYYRWIDPKSPPGKLLTLGWKAVPALLDELDSPSLTPGRRAWILAILFSITSYHDPRSVEGVLAAYDSKESGWAIRSGSNGKVSLSGAGWGGDSSQSGGKINLDEQQKFAKLWKTFRDYIVVRERGANN